MVAFSLNSSAQLTPESSADLVDSIYCSAMANFYVSEQTRKDPSLTDREKALIRQAYQTGCLETRREARVNNTKTLSPN